MEITIKVRLMQFGSVTGCVVEIDKPSKVDESSLEMVIETIREMLQLKVQEVAC